MLPYLPLSVKNVAGKVDFERDGVLHPGVNLQVTETYVSPLCVYRYIAVGLNPEVGEAELGVEVVVERDVVFLAELHRHKVGAASLNFRIAYSNLVRDRGDEVLDAFNRDLRIRVTSEISAVGKAELLAGFASAD